MVSLSDIRSRPQVMPSLGLAVVILGLLTAIRLVGLKFSVVDLFFDEAQYWAWSRELDFGYFSKPPLLAWTIALAERVCGSSEACIRAPAPILYFGTSLVVYAIARELYDGRVAFYAALSTALATGCVFSSRIISTDVPLLFFWALALLAYVKLLRGGGVRWTVLLGIAIGLGLLAKYAMIYILLGVALAAILDADARRLALSPRFWLALAIAAIVVAPNIIWNLNHDLATFRHTGDNIEGGGLAFSPGKGFEFLAAQFGVFGPVVFAVLLYAIARIGSAEMGRADRLMLAFAIPPLALVTAVGFVTRALANWAAPTFIAATIVVIAILVRREAWKWLTASLAIGVVAQAALLAGDAVATKVTIPGVRDGDVYRRTLGWRSLGEQTGEWARRAGARTIVAEDRQEEASLIYYWRDQPEPVLAWPRRAEPEHHFDLTRALTDAAAQPILFVTRCPAQPRLAAQFADVQPLGSFQTPSGPTTQRTYYVFKLDGRIGAIRLFNVGSWRITLR
jgi:4-amino-4-deoxy-L-arabinose transferase-like glycosyltransferase